jgi:isoleucyl-tRNA synthetase
MPFTTEAIWQNLRIAGEAESVHLADFPAPSAALRDSELEFKMAAVLHAVQLGRSLRSAYNIKNRQPLSKCQLVSGSAKERAALLEMEDIVAEELNVKEVVFAEREDELVSYEAKANFRVLGKEIGKDMKAAAEKIAALGQDEIRALLDGSILSIEVAGRQVDITSEKVEIRRIEKTGLKVINEGTLTVALDTEITPALLLEGEAKDLVRGIQNERKLSGLDVSDRIKLTLFGSEHLKTAFDTFTNYISSETLAVSVEWKQVPEQKDIEAGEEIWKAALGKV